MESSRSQRAAISNLHNVKETREHSRCGGANTPLEASAWKSKREWKSGARTDNSQLLHAEVQRGAIHSEPSCRPSWSGENPSGLFQDRANVLALDVRQSFQFFAGMPHDDARLKIPTGHAQDRAARKNHSSLDHVFQFADVARPLVIGERCHGVR